MYSSSRGMFCSSTAMPAASASRMTVLRVMPDRIDEATGGV